MRTIRFRCALPFVMACALGGCSGSTTGPTPTPTPTPSPQPPSIPAGLSVLLTQMLNGLPAYITAVLAENQSLIPNNPQSRTYIQAKIDALQNPALFADIVNGGRWAEGLAGSPLGPAVPIATVFMLEPMRGEAGDAVRTIELALPVLEGFFNVRFPAGTVRIWYGFKVGNTGGGGVIYTEDRGTYIARTSAGALPHDSILCHELSHSFISNESLTQFLELYGYNVSRGGSTDVASWTFTRNWAPGLSSNTGSAALLDVYQLIGHDAMRNAYRAVYPLRPPYGQALSQAVIDAFLSQVPAQHQLEVSMKLRTIVF